MGSVLLNIKYTIDFNYSQVKSFVIIQIDKIEKITIFENLY